MVDVIKKRTQWAICRELTAIMLFGVMVNANAQAPGLEPVYVDSRLSLRFPAKLSQLQYERVVEFSDKRLGYCVKYKAETALGQICVYDFGHQNLATGVDSKEFKDALKTAEDGMREGINSGPFRKGKLFIEGAPLIESGGKTAKVEMRIFTSEMDASAGTEPDQNTHLILMTTGLGKFLKLNYSAKNQTTEAFTEETRKILTDFLAPNAATMEQLLVEVKK